MWRGVVYLTSRGVQLISAYSWTRPAILESGKGRRGMFLISSVSSLSFLFRFLPCPSLSSPLLSLLSLFPFPLETTQNDPQGLTCRVVKPQHNQYSSDPLKSHFYIVKLVFTGVYIIMLISAKNIYCGYSLEPPHRGGSNEYPQSMFWAEIWKISKFLSKKFLFLVVKFSIYLNRCVFVIERLPSVSRFPLILSLIEFYRKKKGFGISW